jgi:hypothetical protein
MTIADRAVLVTGANRGIGQALVEEALKRGAKRVFAGTRQPLAHSDARVTPLTLDVTNAAQIHGAVERVESLDILINNAGLALFDDLSDRAALERHLAVNLFGTYGVTQAYLPLLTRSRGAIVNVLSIAALTGLPIVPAYSISKRGAPLYRVGVPQSDGDSLASPRSAKETERRDCKRRETRGCRTGTPNPRESARRGRLEGRLRFLPAKGRGGYHCYLLPASGGSWHHIVDQNLGFFDCCFLRLGNWGSQNDVLRDNSVKPVQFRH